MPWSRRLASPVLVLGLCALVCDVGLGCRLFNVVVVLCLVMGLFFKTQSHFRNASNSSGTPLIALLQTYHLNFTASTLRNRPRPESMATQDEKIKWVEGSPFMVDGFRFANPRCKHYLLTHFHSGLVGPYFMEVFCTAVGYLAVGSPVKARSSSGIICTAIEVQVSRFGASSKPIDVLGPADKPFGDRECVCC